MQNASNKILEEVTRTNIELLLREPFYSHLFSTLNKEVVDEASGIGTMAVGLRFDTYTLFVNAEFWETFLVDKKHRYGVLKHEILHIIFKHLLVNEPTFDRKLLNIAMDLVVNQYIERAQLPDESIFLTTFPELNLLPDQTYFYYYKELEKLQQNCNNNGNLKDSISAKNLASIGDNTHGLERHEQWREIFEKSKIDKDLIDAFTENLIRIAHDKTPLKSIGTLPAGIQIQLKNVLFKPTPLVDWRRILKLFAESSAKTRVKNTLKRTSKRYGTTPGIKIKHFQKLLVAIDTSGSIGKTEYEVFFSELYHIWRRGAEIQVVECDATIQKTYLYKGETPNVIHGGGGTDFNDPIRFGNEKYRPDGLIYFTDGYAAVPTITPVFPILWVISPEGLPPDAELFEQLPGRKAKLQIATS
jgi:predicted metal-dependent peptidase